MRRTRSPKRSSSPPFSRNFRPRLEALEDRFLLSGSPPAPSLLTTVPSLASLNPQQELILPDGKILVATTVMRNLEDPDMQMYYGGTANRLDIAGWGTVGVTSIELFRFNADGSPDTTFGYGGAIMLQPDLSDFFARFAVAPDGSIYVADAEVNSDNGYLVPAPYNSPFGDGQPAEDLVPVDSGLRLIKLSADGLVDNSFQAANIPGFSVDTMGVDGTVGAMTVQPDGKLIVAGEEEGFGNSTLFVARYNPDGSFDPSFNPGGAQPGVVTTAFSNPPAGFDPRFSTFDYQAGYGYVSSVAVDGSGKIVVGANESEFGMVVLRFNADGSTDTGFGSGGMVTYSAGSGLLTYLSSAAVQSDGKVVVAGYARPVLPTDSISSDGLVLIRFNTDGSFDNSFGQQGVVLFGTRDNPLGPYTLSRPALPIELPVPPFEGSLVLGGATGLLIQPDGKIVVAGTGSVIAPPSYGQTGVELDQPLIARFNADGSPDTTFGPGGVQLTTYVSDDTDYRAVDTQTISLAPDGSILALGDLDYGSYIPFQEPGLSPDVVLVDFQGETTDGTDVVVTPATPVPQAAAVSDAAFQQLQASVGTHPAAEAAGSPVTPNLFVPLPVNPLMTSPLPTPGLSQSAAVAKLSGGGDTPIAADDPFGLTGEPDRIWYLASSGEAAGPG